MINNKLNKKGFHKIKSKANLQTQAVWLTVEDNTTDVLFLPSIKRSFRSRRNKLAKEQSPKWRDRESRDTI